MDILGQYADFQLESPLFSLAVISSGVAVSCTLIVTQVVQAFKIHELILIGTDIFIL